MLKKAGCLPKPCQESPQAAVCRQTVEFKGLGQLDIIASFRPWAVSRGVRSIFQELNSTCDGVFGSAEEGSKRPPDPADEKDHGYDKGQGDAAANVRMHG